MNIEALTFFGNRLSNLDKKLSYFFNFNKNYISGNIFGGVSGRDKNIITGYILPDTGNFWDFKNNAGFLSGNYILLENLTGSSFDFKNFSYLTSIEKLNYDGGVLLSSIEESTKKFINSDGEAVEQNYYKGFEFGITANNYLYFEYFRNTGPEILILDNKLNDKSVIYLSLNKNDLNYGFIDFNKNKTINKFANISSDYLFEQNRLYIGYNPQASSLYSNNKNFVGCIEDIILGSPGFFEYETISLSSGFVQDFTPNTQYALNTIRTGITGSYKAITGYRTEITGYEKIATGIFTNPWGISVMGYTSQPLIRQVPLSGTFYLSGEIVNSFTGISGLKYEINNQKLLSYQKNVVNFLNRIDNDDFIDTRALTGYNTQFFNKKNVFMEYDRFSDSYKNLAKPGEFYNIFVNGQLQRSGNIFFSTLPYETNKLIIENDFGVDPRNGNRIVFNNFYGLKGESSVVFDKSNSSNLYLGEIEDLNILDNNNDDLFLNGQKLSEKIHYDTNNNFLLKNKFNTNIDLNFHIKSNFAHNKDADIFITSKYDGMTQSAIIPIYIRDNNNWILKHEISGFNFPIHRINTNSNASIITVSVLSEPSPQELGVVYIYTGNKNNGWKLKQTLTGECTQFTFPNTDCDSSIFGDTVKISENGSTILITNPIKITGSNTIPVQTTRFGIVNLYTGNSNNGWSLKQTIYPPLPIYPNNFGSNVEMYKDGSMLFISENFSTYNYLSIYTGNNNGWSLKQIIPSSGVLDLSSFMIDSISISNNEDVIALGCPRYGDNLFLSGITLIYTGDKNNQWHLKQKITGDGLNFNFGTSTSINNDNSIIAIGANYDKWLTPLGFLNNNRGSVFIFTGDRNNGWNFYQKLSGENIDSAFGTFVSINNNKNYIFVDHAESYASLFTNNNIVLNKNLSLTGSLISVSKNFDYNLTTSGTPILNLNNNFYFDHTEVYVNGIRQTLNYDYLELSKFDIATGIKILLENNKNYIYNNEGFIK
jgi:hypothetical protein